MASFDFARRLLAWQQKFGRHQLPWQNTRDPYRIWLSEVMLQQTQVTTVIAYYLRFLQHFPKIQDLAAAPLEKVLYLWSGLGYYRRAHHLHRCAHTVVSDFSGCFPTTAEQLATLPGIGRSTAAAIAVFAYGQRSAILDGNVKRILMRLFGTEPQTDAALWQLAENLLPHHDIQAYTQGLMDFGSMVCRPRQPLCQKDKTACPFHQECVALRENKLSFTQNKLKNLQQRNMLLIFFKYNQHIFLQQRPNAGIWSGLWCPPELLLEKEPPWPFTTFAQLDEHLRAAIEKQALKLRISPMAIQSIHSMAAHSHPLTHLRLRLFPLVIHLAPLRSARQKVAQPQHGNTWYTQDQALPLPRPIQNLLKFAFSLNSSHH